MFYIDRSRKRALRDLFDAFNDNFFDDAFSIISRDNYRLRADLIENDNDYDLTLEIPGLDKEDIKISYQDNYLTVAAEKKTNIDKSDEEKNYVHKEIYYGSINRKFYLEGIDSNNIKASYNNGILNVKLPKKEIESSKKYITIE